MFGMHDGNLAVTGSRPNKPTKPESVRFSQRALTSPTADTLVSGILITFAQRLSAPYFFAE